ncbi:MAG: hypothetical protein LBM27_01010, partial [Lactobacillaceae bacterium]|nr:hypothetical protein [Lactobacillaceae bacterium]
MRVFKSLSASIGLILLFVSPTTLNAVSISNASSTKSITCSNEEKKIVTKPKTNAVESGFMSQGVVYANDYKWTYYCGAASYIANHGAGFGEFGLTDDGYIALAAAPSMRNTLVETPWGTGKVVDTGTSSEIQNGTKIDVFVFY